MSGKFKIVVSDLHLGAGCAGGANPLEDFGRDREFAALLEEIATESERDGTSVELIINGDAFEMLQVPHVDRFDPAVVYPPERYYSSAEEDSARKMGLIIAGHRPFFDALGRFLRVGPPRRSVTFIKGNHDVDLHWPAVQDRIRRATGAVSGRAWLLSFEERRISREGIYVEHGNQYAEPFNRLEDMEEPHDHDKPGQLALPMGSRFVIDVFNEVEREKYWVDGVKPITALIWYSLAYDFPFAARALARLLRALPRLAAGDLLAVEEPHAELARQLEDPATVEEWAARYEADEAFRAAFNAELADILAPPPDSPGAEMAVVASLPDPVAIGAQIQARIRSSLYGIAQLRAVEEDARLVIFGHIHDAGSEPLSNGGLYINSGTWTWRADFSGAGKETWRDLFEHPERFTADRLLSYVRVDYDGSSQPSARLLAYKPSSAPRPKEVQAVFLQRILDWLRGPW